MLNCYIKMKSNDKVILDIFYVEESSNLIGQENFGTKISEPDCKVLEMTESVRYFYECLPICKNQHHRSNLNILQIQYWVLLLACPGVPDHTHQNDRVG